MDYDRPEWSIQPNYMKCDKINIKPNKVFLKNSKNKFSSKSEWFVH